MSQPVPGNSELRINQAAAPDGARVYLFRVLSATGPQDIRRFAGVTFSRSYVQSALLKGITRAANPIGADTKPVFAVFEIGRQILASPGWSGHAESRSSLAPRLPLWEVAGAYSGTTVEDIARDQFRRNLLISLLALVALGVAAFATFVMAARESRLAGMKSAFVSNVSHEMLTPISVLQSRFENMLNEGKLDEAGLPLLRAFRGLPKNKALTKFLSEQGVRALLQKTENHYMQDQNKEMHKR